MVCDDLTLQNGPSPPFRAKGFAVDVFCFVSFRRLKRLWEMASSTFSFLVLPGRWELKSKVFHEAEVHPQWLLRLLIPSNMLQSDSRASTQLDNNNNSCAGTVQLGLSCPVAFDLLKCPPLMALGLRFLQTDICLSLQVRDFLLNQHMGNTDR